VKYFYLLIKKKHLFKNAPPVEPVVGAEMASMPLTALTE